MNKIVFFDIDRTLFDPGNFLQKIFEELARDFELGENSEDFRSIYEEVKSDEGYFIPEKFMDKIIFNYPSIKRNRLEEVFWKDELFVQSLYADADAIRNLSSRATLGIYSKGDKKFQIKKLEFLSGLIDERNIFIYPNKVEHANEVFSNYLDSQVYLVDNEIKVLTSVLNVCPEVSAILIDRNNNLEDNQGVTKINSLTDLVNII